MRLILFPNKLFALLLALATILIDNNLCLGQGKDSIYHVKFASTGVVNQTDNGDSYLLSNALAFNITRNKMTLNSNSGWVYGQQNSNLTNNDFWSYADVDFLKRTHRLYYWGLLTYDKSYSLKITNRLQAGAGAAYKAVENKTLKLTVSDGFLYETNNLEDAKIGHDIYQTVRNSLRIKYTLTLKEGMIKLEGTGFYQPSMLDISDYIIKATNSLSVKLNKWLSITASETNNVISRTERKNLLITFGLVAEKYW